MPEQLKKLFGSLTARQQISLAAAAIVMALTFWGIRGWNRERNFRPLYTGLAAEDAGAVVERLRAENVEYRLDEGGSTVRVPSERADELRLRLASAGLPKTGRIGFELFDQNNFGLTEFAEQVNFRRAIEGELERSIQAIGEIERARVHISLPRDSVFLESRQEAKASVMLQLRRGVSLSAQNGVAICHLVASAVDRLAPESVTVLDTRGNLLVKPKKANQDEIDPPEEGLAYRQKLERDMLQKIQLTLEPLLGPEHFRANVSVECDFSSGEQSEESYDPARSVMLTSQRSEDVSGVAQAGGTPGTASNLPRPALRPAGSGGAVARRTENITYQSSKLVRHTRLPRGNLKRLSVALLVDQELQWQGTGRGAKRILKPPSDATMKTIRDLVSAAVGFSSERGDRIMVESLPFETTLSAEPPLDPTKPPPADPGSVPLPPWLRKYLSMMNPALLAGVVVGALLVLLAPVVWWVLKRRKNKVKVKSAPKLPPGESAGAAADSAETMDQIMAERKTEHSRLETQILKELSMPAAETRRAEVLVKQLREIAKTEPTAAANLLRDWIHDIH